MKKFIFLLLIFSSQLFADCNLILTDEDLTYKQFFQSENYKDKCLPEAKKDAFDVCNKYAKNCVVAIDIPASNNAGSTCTFNVEGTLSRNRDDVLCQKIRECIVDPSNRSEVSKLATQAKGIKCSINQVLKKIQVDDTGRESNAKDIPSKGTENPFKNSQAKQQ